ncbi:hypothetical protein ACFL4A_04740, partial [bacterium]
FVYEKNIGDYKNTALIQQKLFNDLISDNIACTRGFGIYYDNPANVETENLRSISGCIIEYKDRSKLERIRAHYNILEVPLSKGIVSEFPMKNPISFIIGMMKVYPKMSKYIMNRQIQTGPAIEIYDMLNRRIEYFFPTENLESFFVNFENQEA